MYVDTWKTYSVNIILIKKHKLLNNMNKACIYTFTAFGQPFNAGLADFLRHIYVIVEQSHK